MWGTPSHMLLSILTHSKDIYFETCKWACKRHTTLLVCKRLTIDGTSYFGLIPVYTPFFNHVHVGQRLIDTRAQCQYGVTTSVQEWDLEYS